MNSTKLFWERVFFRIPWVEAPSATTARDGLGPLFNANTCTSCHPNNAYTNVFTSNGEVNRAMVVRLSVPSNSSKEHQHYLKKTRLYSRTYLRCPTFCKWNG